VDAAIGWVIHAPLWQILIVIGLCLLIVARLIYTMIRPKRRVYRHGHGQTKVRARQAKW